MDLTQTLRSCTWRKIRNNNGSIMPLLIGLLALVVMAAGAVVDLSALYLNQRALLQIADSAALTAVTSLDHVRYYESGAESLVPTKDEAAIVADVVSRSQLPRARIEEVQRDDGSVAVVLALDVTLPWPLIAQSVTVRARAKAEVLSK